MIIWRLNRTNEKNNIRWRKRISKWPSSSGLKSIFHFLDLLEDYLYEDE
jgi:hypothetical protein